MMAEEEGAQLDRVAKIDVESQAYTLDPKLKP
jgi:hypothetical protein